MNLTDLAIAGLATWRLCHILLYEAGPFAAFRKARELLGVEYSVSGSVTSYRWEITTCMFCLSVWVGGLVGLGLWLWPSFTWLLLPFALSAVACMIGASHD